MKGCIKCGMWLKESDKVCTNCNSTNIADHTTKEFKNGRLAEISKPHNQKFTDL